MSRILLLSIEIDILFLLVSTGVDVGVVIFNGIDANTVIAVSSCSDALHAFIDVFVDDVIIVSFSNVAPFCQRFVIIFIVEDLEHSELLLCEVRVRSRVLIVVVGMERVETSFFLVRGRSFDNGRHAETVAMAMAGGFSSMTICSRLPAAG
jgi:hypothetical protein